MKNFKCNMFFVLLVGILSSGFAFTPHRLEPVDVRSEGMGGSYFTDSESFYTLVSNPAGLAFAEKKTLFPTLLSNTSGISSELNGLLWGMLAESLEFGLMDVSAYDEINMPSWHTFFAKDFDFRANQRMSPLTFGAIKNNFGWGVIQAAYFDVEGTSLLDVSYEMGLGLDLVFGYSIPINLGFLGKLAFGFSGRGITQLGIPFDSESIDIGSSSSDDVPLNVVLGFGFDVGIQYEVLNLINIAVVWQDAYSPVWTKRFAYDEDEYGYTRRSSSFEKTHLAQKVGVGIGLDIPLERITRNFISHFGIYANHNDLRVFFNEDIICCNQIDSMHDFGCGQVVDLSIGAELVLFETIAVRVGVYGINPSIGLGLYLGNFRMDFSLSNEGIDMDSSLWITGISMAVHY